MWLRNPKPTSRKAATCPETGADSGSPGAPALLLLLLTQGYFENSCPGASWQKTCPATQCLKREETKSL